MDTINILEAILLILGLGGTASSPWWLKYAKGLLTVNMRYTDVLEQVNALHMKVEHLELENTSLKQSDERKQININELIQQVRTQNTTIQHLQAELGERDSQIKEERTRYDAKINDMQTRMDEQQGQISEQAARLDAVTKDKETLARELAESKDALRDERHEHALTRIKAETLDKALDVLRDIKPQASESHETPPPETNPEPSETTAQAGILTPDN